MSNEAPRRDRWRARPILGGGLRLAILAVPAAVSFAVTLVMRSRLPVQRGVAGRAALLHDIGKLSVRARTLNKPGRLDAREWEEVKRHPLEGERIAEPLLAWLGEWGDTIAHHHERFDGDGYPNRLAGEGISYGGRIVAVADAYDTMTAARTYKRPMATRAARQELAPCAGGQFDPVIVRAFFSISLPRLVWKTGPLSFLVQLPFLARLQEVGVQTLANVGQVATAAAAAAAVGAAIATGPLPAASAAPAP